MQVTLDPAPRVFGELRRRKLGALAQLVREVPRVEAEPDCRYRGVEELRLLVEHLVVGERRTRRTGVGSHLAPGTAVARCRRPCRLAADSDPAQRARVPGTQPG